ncbi:hypothetical protein DO72_5731 [Burkholderia pseudomallei]|nr:hypothetical protein DO63_5908 [Burkholderia pseudomallei]KGD25749.1 hypothetical protein DO70_5305 [Burkholderia pseudomallei]KGD43947.1 hypothetical protein DO72_5731 [Burkholderia pseudomallei]KGD51878.1 hypothetical protein DP43_5648 [Burkholderia pseudomallei]
MGRWGISLFIYRSGYAFSAGTIRCTGRVQCAAIMNSRC